MEARLAPAGFMRISRSVIVNLARIREVQPTDSGRYSLLRKNGTRLDMTCTLGGLQARLGEVGSAFDWSRSPRFSPSPLNQPIPANEE